MAIRSQIPRLKKNESAASFKARVKTWELRTGKKYPKPGIGPRSDEQRILAGALTIGSLDNRKDYSKGKEGEKWRDEVSALALKELRIQKSLEATEALQQKINADRRAGKLSNIPAPKEEPIEAETGGWDEVEGGQPSAGRQSLLYDIAQHKTKKAAKAAADADAEADLQDAKDLRIGSKAGMTEWTTDQKASDQGSFTDKGGKGGVSESKASGNNSNFKSDVFTINPETGKAVGVLTRSQRRAFEKKYGDKIDKLKIRTYRNKGNTYQRYG